MSAYSDLVLSDSPYAYYRMDDSGTALTDFTGNGRSGTFTVAPTRGVTGLVAGDSNTATTFAGNTYGDVTGGTEPNPATTTIEFLMSGGIGAFSGNPLDRDFESAGNRVFQVQTGLGGINWLLWLSTGSYYQASTAGQFMVAGNHHVALTYDGSEQRMYVNGYLLSTIAISGTIQSSTRRIRIGNHGIGGSAFTGTLDEVALYPTALSQGKVQSRVDLAAATGVLGDGSSEVNSSNPVSAAFDNNTGTQWLAATSTGWLRVRYGVATSLDSYTVRGQGNVGTFQSKSWTFEGSNDGSSWTNLDTVTNHTWGTTTEAYTKTFTTPTTAYKQFRVSVTENYGGTYCGFSEYYTTPTAYVAPPAYSFTGWGMAV